jgi:hypothetical protein
VFLDWIALDKKATAYLTPFGVGVLCNIAHSRTERLLQLSDFGEHTESAQAVMSVDQGTMAEIVGTTRSRVNHFMLSSGRRVSSTTTAASASTGRC